MENAELKSELKSLRADVRRLKLENRQQYEMLAQQRRGLAFTTLAIGLGAMLMTPFWSEENRAALEKAALGCFTTGVLGAVFSEGVKPKQKIDEIESDEDV